MAWEKVNEFYGLYMLILCSCFFLEVERNEFVPLEQHWQLQQPTYSDQMMLFLYLFITFFTSVESIEVVLNSRLCIWLLSSEFLDTKLAPDGTGHRNVSFRGLFMDLKEWGLHWLTLLIKHPSMTQGDW